MNKTPLLEFVYNRKKTAGTNREAAVELRITFERRQKYMTTGIRLLPKHWHRGAVVNRINPDFGGFNISKGLTHLKP